MYADILSFVLSSGNRKTIVKTLFEYPLRQWSCSALEELTKISHATVFRTLSGLKNFGILKTIKVNKKDLVYELVSDSPLAVELKKAININIITAKSAAANLVDLIKSKSIYSIILYGSSVIGNLKQDSDIDILIVLNKHDIALEQNILDKSAEYSSKINKTIAVVIMDKREIEKEKNNIFMQSVISSKVVLYGKEPF